MKEYTIKSTDGLEVILDQHEGCITLTILDGKGRPLFECQRSDDGSNLSLAPFVKGIGDFLMKENKVSKNPFLNESEGADFVYLLADAFQRAAGLLNADKEIRPEFYKDGE